MRRQQQVLTSILTTLACGLLALATVAQVQAQEKKADANGTWTWSMQGRDGNPGRQITLKLKVEGEKVTGTITTPGRQGGEPRSTAIEDGKIKGDEVSFAVVREFNGNKMTQKYHGKVAGDAIKGKIEFERNGETQSRDWDAKRSTEKTDKPEQK